jgi:hypothetical protein
MHFNFNSLAALTPNWESIKQSTKLFFAESPVFNPLPSIENVEGLPAEFSNFAGHYRQYILPNVERFEQNRITKLNEFRYRLWGATAGTVLVIFIASIVLKFSSLRAGGDVIFGLGAMAISGIAYWASGPIQKYKEGVKAEIFPFIFSYFAQQNIGEFFYNQNSPIMISQFQDSDILPAYDNCHLEDYVKGEYNNVSLETLEAKMTQTRGSGKNRRTVVTFKGIFIRLSMNKSFHGHTIIKKDGGKIGNWFTDKFSKGNEKQRVALEDPQFEKLFEVYGSDQVEARYLLTPSFMERLMKISDLFESKGIQAALYNKHLLLMIPTLQDRFEVASIFTPATFQDEIVHILQEMQQLFSLIELLKLQENTRL